MGNQILILTFTISLALHLALATMMVVFPESFSTESQSVPVQILYETSEKEEKQVYFSPKEEEREPDPIERLKETTRLLSYVSAS